MHVILLCWDSQIAAVVAMKKPELILKFKFVSIQSGTFDCGLFTIAFANALALGEKPQDVFLTRGTRGYTSGKEMKSTLKKSLSTESAEFLYMHCSTSNYVLLLTQMYHGSVTGVCGMCTSILLFS